MNERIPRSVLAVIHVSQHSGPQRSLHPRLRLLADSGSKITTLVPGPGPAAELGKDVGQIVTGGPEALVIPRSPKDAVSAPLRLVRGARKVEKVAADIDADLVIVSSAHLPDALEGARRAGAATMLYAGEVLGGNGLRGSLQRRLARASAERSDVIIAPSNTAAHTYRALGYDPTILHPPIEMRDEDIPTDAEVAALRERLGIPHDIPIVSSLGAITHGRGQDLLVEALALSRKQGNDWHLVIAGEPYDRRPDIRFHNELKQLITGLNLSEHVTLAGRVDNPLALYRLSDVFVNPTRVPESFGRAACEALLAGSPVVSTRIGGTTEALGHQKMALLVPPNAPSEMSVTIDRLLNDRGRVPHPLNEAPGDLASKHFPRTDDSTFVHAVRQSLYGLSDAPRMYGAESRSK